MNKQFFAIITIVVVALVGVFALTGNNSGDSGGGGSADAQPSNHVVGPENAKVTLIEYGDFQCPACKSYYPIVNQLKADYADRVAFQFRHFPLVQIHPNGFISSRAAEAAGKQDKFYEMHDLLYENQESWASSSNAAPIFEGYAEQLGLDVEQFKTDMSSPAVADTINADSKAGQEAGANSTPTFALNGNKIEQNPQSLEDFKKLLDEALAQN